MRTIIDIALFLIFISMGGDIAKEIYFKVKKATVIKLHEGVPPLTPFTERLIGRKVRF